MDVAGWCVQVYSIGPSGGDGGDVRDMVADPRTRILKVMVRHGKAIDAIRIMYRCDGGGDEWTDWWGGKGGRSAEFTLDDDEYITCIDGRYGTLHRYLIIRSLTFVSNKRTYGPFGEEDGTYFQLDAQGGEIVGFFARSAAYLDAIGVYTISFPHPHPPYRG